MTTKMTQSIRVGRINKKKTRRHLSSSFSFFSSSILDSLLVFRFSADLFLLGFTGFYWVLLGFTGFYLVLLGFTGFYWVLLGFTGFYWVLLGFIRFYWVLLGFIGFYWVLLGFT